MIVTCRQMQDLEASAFARGVSAERLMDEAGLGIAQVVQQFFPVPGRLVLYLGKGNNAGDALVAARYLSAGGWTVAARFCASPAEFKPLPSKHWETLSRDTSVAVAASAVAACAGCGPLVLLDGLLGIGASGPLRGSMAELATEMNRLRHSHHATVVALDLPSGLNGDTGSPAPVTVTADLTVTIGQVKAGLLADQAINHVGRLALVSLPDLRSVGGGAELITADLLRPLLPRRPFDTHKGHAGRVAVIAGSRGFLGAGVLAASSALHGGAGLTTLFAKPKDYDLLAMKAPPEVMVRSVPDYRAALEGHDSLAIGPGLGFEFEDEILDVITRAEKPMVIDADALTLLARKGMPSFHGPRLLTPHPGEMARLIANTPEWSALDRAALAEAFATRNFLTLLLKGARTVIATPGAPTRYNSTGTPGMASGGMGDVLSGLCAALAAQGMGMHNAASTGSWLLGRAAEICLADSSASEESLSAMQVAQSLGAAFSELKRGCY